MQKGELHTYLKASCSGKQNAISSTRLEQTLHVSGNELRKQVNRLRRDGVPIASSDAGYYYAATASELYATIRSLQKMSDGLNAAIRGLERAMQQFTENRGPL